MMVFLPHLLDPHITLELIFTVLESQVCWRCESHFVSPPNFIAEETMAQRDLLMVPTLQRGQAESGTRVFCLPVRSLSTLSCSAWGQLGASSKTY